MSDGFTHPEDGFDYRWVGVELPELNRAMDNGWKPVPGGEAPDIEFPFGPSKRSRFALHRRQKVFGKDGPSPAEVIQAMSGYTGLLWPVTSQPDAQISVADTEAARQHANRVLMWLDRRPMTPTEWSQAVSRVHVLNGPLKIRDRVGYYWRRYLKSRGKE